jgi:acetolactate synthase-1/2/3 large subunit
LLGTSAVREAGLLAASRVAEHVSAKLLAESFPGRLERGAGLPAVERLAYLAEFAMAQMEGLRHIVLVDARPPVSPFAYPGKPSDLVPAGCTVHLLAGEADDAIGALEALADVLGAATDGARLVPHGRPDRPTGALTPASVALAIGALLPENAIISDEAITGAIYLAAATEGAPRHDVLSLTGNSIGQGLPLATGASVACPDRPVLALEADGSAMYTIQALWTQAREGLDVTTVIYDNGSYAILNIELGRVGAEAGGPRARSMLEIGRPDLDFVALAEAMGVPATRTTTAEELSSALARSFAEEGPHLIQAVLPRRGL